MRLFHTTLLTLTLAFTSCSSPSVAEEETLFENGGTEKETQLNVTISETETELFNVVNAYRTANGLNALAFSNETYKYAEEHTQFMIIENEISHDNFNDRATKIAKETDATHIAENVAKNYPEVEMALQAWLESAEHKGTIEGNFTHTAISIKENSQGKLYYTQIFLKK